jgi:ParB/RepB/Spo0J family partition protein
MAVTTIDQARHIALERIRVPDNVRDLDGAHVDALAGSIALQGMLVPVVVRPDGDDFELVAGFHRIAAVRKLGLAAVPCVVREAETEDADRAIENITRKQLNPYEEARAVKAMLDRGLTEDGAAQALGWAKQRVTARVKLLELPDRAQQLIGEGELPLACVDTLRRIGEVSKPIQELVIEYLDHDDTAWLRERLESEPAWIIGRALDEVGSSKTFAAYLTGVGKREVAELKLGKKADQQSAELEALYKELNLYGYSSHPIRFGDLEVDQARAAGVLIDFEHGSPIITDRKLYRELVKQALAHSVDDYRDKAAVAREAKKTERRAGGAKAADPLAEAKRTHRDAIRELADQAHGVNLDLGAALINGLSRVDPNDIDVARFFVYGLLGPDPERSSYYSDAGERVRRIAAHGVRIVVEDFREDVTKTKKDGTRGRLRIDYGDRQVASNPTAATTWLWKFIDGAKTAGELYGRALVVIAAERYAASRVVLPSAQRAHPQHFGSHKDLAEKALAKLAGPHVPASMKQLSKAIDAAHAALHKAEDAVRESRSRQVADDRPDDTPPVDDTVDEDLDAALAAEV